VTLRYIFVYVLTKLRAKGVHKPTPRVLRSLLAVEGMRGWGGERNHIDLFE